MTDPALISAAWPGIWSAAIVMVLYGLIAKRVGPKTGRK